MLALVVTQSQIIEATALLVVVEVGLAVLGYQESERFKREFGKTPWGFPSRAWAALTFFFSIIMSVPLWLARITTRKLIAELSGAPVYPAPGAYAAAIQRAAVPRASRARAGGQTPAPAAAPAPAPGAGPASSAGPAGGAPAPLGTSPAASALPARAAAGAAPGSSSQSAMAQAAARVAAAQAAAQAAALAGVPSRGSSAALSGTDRASTYAPVAIANYGTRSNASNGAGGAVGSAAKQAGGVAATSTLTALPEAAWYADPVARNELRYWDGTAWTQWVSNGRMTTADPL